MRHHGIYIHVRGGCWVCVKLADFDDPGGKSHYRWFPDGRIPGYREMEVT